MDKATIVGWNIRAGGGTRAQHIADQVIRWGADIAALSEFRATPGSTTIAAMLAEAGLSYQLTTADPRLPARNALLIASRWPVRRLRLHHLPRPTHRILPSLVETPQPLMLAAVHGPLGATGLRRPFNDRLLAMVRRWKRTPGIVIGDTNTGRPGIDEESPVFSPADGAWMVAMGRAGWPDVYRLLRRKERVFTWYSPNRGNGFRLDQAFVRRSLLPNVLDVRYEWGRNGDPGARRDAVSDHAAIIVELALPAAPPLATGGALDG